MRPIKQLGVWLHLTDVCNLRCNYCFLPHDPVTMKLDIGYGAMDKVFELAVQYQSESVQVKYAGGEPLVVFETLLAIDAYAKILSSRHGVAYHGQIITNGTLLTEDTIRAIHAAHLSLTVSLDGLGKYNNHRLYTNHTSSVGESIANIKRAIAQGVLPHINVVVGEHNIQGLPQFTQWLLEHQLTFSFSLVRSHHYTPEFVALEEQKILQGLVKSFEVIHANLPPYPLAHWVSDKMNPLFAHHHTCGAGENYLVFDPKGAIAKCQMELHKPVSHYRSVDPIADIRGDQRFVRSVDVDTIEECKTCEIRYFCTAGCPIETYQKTGSYTKKSPNCTIYKTLFDEALKLEALRLIQWGG